MELTLLMVMQLIKRLPIMIYLKVISLYLIQLLQPPVLIYLQMKD